LHGAPPPVYTAATVFQELAYKNKDALSANMIIAGWDKEVGPSVYNVLRSAKGLCPALALAMSRDGSSGGVIRMCVITKEGVERLFVPGDQLPQFWEGREIISFASKAGREPAHVLMAVEAL
jgi:20S proteasome subunit beta 1